MEGTIMTDQKKQLVGYLRGQLADGSEAIVRVSKIGKDYRIGHDFKEHLCHPSIRNIESVKRELFLVFNVRNAVFEPI